MVKEFKLPDIGEGIHEGEIVRWLVAEGDSIAEDQPIAEVMTDKATVEITSPYSGSVSRLNAAEGESVAVGSTIIVIDDGAGGNGAAPAEAPAKEDAPKAEPPKAEAPKAEAPKAEAPKADAAPAETAPPRRDPAPASSPPVEAEPPAQTSGKVLATPATRKLARELGVDLGNVAGSGARGRVTREDVERAANGHAAAPVAASSRKEAPASAPSSRPAPPSTPAAQGAEERRPLRGLRKKIAEHMALSKRTAAHFTYVEEVDVTELVKFRTEAKATMNDHGIRLTYLPFIMKAIVGGLKKFPMLNASLDEAAGEIVLKRYYNFGIAVDTPGGLVVPVVKDVDRLTIAELAREVERVATDAREGTIQLDDLRGGTFTITNAGNIGGLFATPVINFPEVAILGVHKIVKRPVVKNGDIVVGDIMYLSISIDHRVVDGADGARFMNEVVRAVSDPGMLLLGV